MSEWLKSADAALCLDTSAPRSVVIGMGAFDALKLVQGMRVATPPRLDMRYLIEGAVGMLCHQPDGHLHEAWIEASTQALLDHASECKSSGARGSIREQAGSESERSAGGDGRSIQIGEACFELLKTKQGTTRDPRLSIRYLVDGAIAVLSGQGARVQGTWIFLARRALQHHLSSLQLDSSEIKP
jgi:hypothetical protein